MKTGSLKGEIDKSTTIVGDFNMPLWKFTRCGQNNNNNNNNNKGIYIIIRLYNKKIIKL